jgi:hypothetical protein
MVPVIQKGISFPRASFKVSEAVLSYRSKQLVRRCVRPTETTTIDMLRGCVPPSHGEDDPIVIHHICCRLRMGPSPTGGRRSHICCRSQMCHDPIVTHHTCWQSWIRLSPTGGRRSHRYTPYMLSIVGCVPPPQGEDDPVATC